MGLLCIYPWYAYIALYLWTLSAQEISKADAEEAITDAAAKGEDKDVAPQEKALEKQPATQELLSVPAIHGHDECLAEATQATQATQGTHKCAL